MTFVVIRLALLFGFLTLVYIALNAYMRWDRLRTLDTEYDDGEGQGLTREDYVTRGLAEYERSWSKKALLGIFVLPLVLIGALALLANYG